MPRGAVGARFLDSFFASYFRKQPKFDGSGRTIRLGRVARAPVSALRFAEQIPVSP
jgi:hypothetical protein